MITGEMNPHSTQISTSQNPYVSRKVETKPLVVARTQSLPAVHQLMTTDLMSRNHDEQNQYSYKEFKGWKLNEDESDSPKERCSKGHCKTNLLSNPQGEDNSLTYEDYLSRIKSAEETRAFSLQNSFLEEDSILTNEEQMCDKNPEGGNRILSLLNSPQNVGSFLSYEDYVNHVQAAREKSSVDFLNDPQDEGNALSYEDYLRGLESITPIETPTKKSHPTSSSREVFSRIISASTPSHVPTQMSNWEDLIDYEVRERKDQLPPPRPWLKEKRDVPLRGTRLRADEFHGSAHGILPQGNPPLDLEKSAYQQSQRQDLGDGNNSSAVQASTPSSGRKRPFEAVAQTRKPMQPSGSRLVETQPSSKRLKGHGQRDGSVSRNEEEKENYIGQFSTVDKRKPNSPYTIDEKLRIRALYMIYGEEGITAYEKKKLISEILERKDESAIAHIISRYRLLKFDISLEQANIIEKANKFAFDWEKIAEAYPECRTLEWEKQYGEIKSSFEEHVDNARNRNKARATEKKLKRQDSDARRRLHAQFSAGQGHEKYIIIED